MLTTLGAMFVVLGVLIFVHELGHFLAAKSVGIAVLRFSLGLGPRTPLVFQRGETEYCVSWIPFGGFVKMAGLEDEGAAGAMEGTRETGEVPRERTFDAKPLWARIWVISAGVLMNVLFAWLTYAVLAATYGVTRDPTTTIGEVKSGELPMGAAALATLRPGERILRINGDSMTGWRDVVEALLTTVATPLRIEVVGRAEPLLVDVPLRDQSSRGKLVEALVPWHEPVIGEVAAGFPAMEAGLLPGDRILRAGGDTVVAWEVLVRAVERSAGVPIDLEIERGGRGGGRGGGGGGRRLTLTVTPREATVPGADGVARKVGRIGVAPVLPMVRYGPIGALDQGLRQAAQAGGLVLFMLKGLILGQLSPRDLGGPILVGQLSGEAARLGLPAFFSFMALFSMNLAVLNLLPIPVLDGGHLVFLMIEGVRRRPLSLVQRQRLTQVGFVVLVAIMALALANDLMRLFSKLFN